MQYSNRNAANRIVTPTGVRAVILAITLLPLAGCDEPPSELEQAIRAAPAERTFKGKLGAESAHLMLHDCKLYRASAGARGKQEWVMVLEPDPYPFFTFCDRQSMSAEKGAVTVTLGRIAFGAGGCCATGGTYRSGDGREWQKLR